MKFITNLLTRLRHKKDLDTNTDKRAQLLEKIIQKGFPEKEVFVTVEEFFDGNYDNYSIGGNVFPEPPGFDKFHEILTEINNAKKTMCLLVRIGEADNEEWFYSDAVYVIGDYSIDEVKQLFASLQPDEVYEGFMYGTPPNLPKVNNAKPYSVLVGLITTPPPVS